MTTKLNQPKLLDFSKLNITDDVLIIILNTNHKFSSNSKKSGINIEKNPIFGSIVYINNSKFLELDYGLPFMCFKKGSNPKLTFRNKTDFTFNIHYHGLNTPPNVDGVNSIVQFGYSTTFGRDITINFSIITNNQGLFWYHAHNAFISMELIQSGLVGLFIIIDDVTDFLEYFKYDDNHLMLIANDLDLNENGILTSNNLIVDENRSCFTAINGISGLNWYSNKKDCFVNKLYHNVKRNLIKIDILNGSLNWRVYYLGVSDKHNKIKFFHFIQTDSGLLNPKKVNILPIFVASRVSILIDLNDFDDKKAYLFFYDYDLTEIVDFSYEDNKFFGISPNFDNPNSTPYPTPIPDKSDLNQQDLNSELSYPILNIIEQKKSELINGELVVKNKNFKIFLKLKYTKDHSPDDLNYFLKKIRKTVFGSNYYLYKNQIENNDFELTFPNYLSFLNKNYFYNLPNITNSIPHRNILLFFESDLNKLSEYCNEANRILVDLWNSDELDLAQAIYQYNLSDCDYRPKSLPSSKFRIMKSNEKFSNITMMSNDTLNIYIYNHEIIYGISYTDFLINLQIIFPETDDLNIVEWIDLVNTKFRETTVFESSLFDLIELSWSFFPYIYQYLNGEIVTIKTAVIKIINKSNYFFDFKAKWPLLQFFGKSLTGGELDLSIIDNTDIDPLIFIPCDEKKIYGINDVFIQQVFPQYSTNDPDLQLPITCMKRSGQLILSPNSIYKGLFDGFCNDNYNSFTVKKDSTEKWIYNNGDTTDSHPFHFHNTSGYIANYNKNLLYSRDIYLIGPQQKIEFYLTWKNYSSLNNSISPFINKNIGYVAHCHFLLHNDSNSMMLQYFIDE